MITLPEAIRKKHFLVTDDYESMRIMLADHLKQLGVTKISFASSGNQAFKLLNDKKNQPDRIEFLLSDMIMDDGNGIELARRMRGELEFNQIPILMITSKAEVNLVIEAVKAGVNNYIVKPWQLEDLSKKIIDSYSKIKG
jgi:two-component system, chemotaxis family, chemotaxis protein CheY